MEITESVEMYLETILVLSKKMKSVRAIDVVTEMGFSKPAVSRALAKLRNSQLIANDPNGFIALTDKGRLIAEDLIHRRTILKCMFMGLGVDEQTAAADACKIEHHLSDATFEAIETHLKAHST